jgi:hypothetical protein
MRRLFTAIAIAAFVATQSPAPGRSADPIKFGNTGSYDYGGGFEYVDPNGPDGFSRTADVPNEQWDIDIVSGPDWSFKDSRKISGVTPTGISYEAAIAETAGYELAVDSTGALTSVHVAADLTTGAIHVGETGVDLSLEIPFRTAQPTVHVTAAFDAKAETIGEGDAGANVHVQVTCTGGPAGSALLDGGVEAVASEGDAPTKTATPPIDVDQPAGDGHCILRVSAESTAEKGTASLIEDGSEARSSAHVDLTVTGAPVPCDLAGSVLDGDLTIDQHANPIPGVPVVLVKDASPTDIKTVSGADGRYCLRGLGGIDLEAAPYSVRAALVDGKHTPALFRTLHQGSTNDLTAAATVNKFDLGKDDIDVAFSDASQPWLADVAAIHRESTRFVDWVLERGVISAEEFGTLPIVTGSTDHKTSYAIDGPFGTDPQTVYIADSETRYACRANARTMCPENGEWHEIGHHVADRLGIAPFISCTRVENHGGWRNPGTCDSLAEGFAIFIALLASTEIDAGRGPGYATSDYSVFGNLEDYGYKPWTLFSIAGTVYGLEDLAVAELLWDLMDDTPREFSGIDLAGSLEDIEYADLIAIDRVALVRFLAATKPSTVAGLRRALLASDVVVAEAKQPILDLDLSGSPDISKLDALFLIHGFHPVHDLAADTGYEIDDPVGSTNREDVDPDTGVPTTRSQVSPLTPREHPQLTPSSAITLTNGGAAPATFMLDLTYPSTASHFEIVVPPNGTELVHLEVPSFTTAFVDPTKPLPACGGKDQHLVTLALSGPGVEAQKLDSCEFAHLAAATTGDSAFSFGVPLASPAPSAAPAATGTGGAAGPLPIVIIIAVVAVLVLLGGVFLARRRSSHGAG